MAARGDVLHRVRAFGDAAFVTTCACGCIDATGADPREVVAMHRLSRTIGETSDAIITALGEPAPL